MTTKWLTFMGLVLGCMLPARGALAGPLIDSSAGLKLLVGADIWTAPSNVPGDRNTLGFTDTAGGFGYGALGYYDLRILKLVGVEVDLAYQHGTFKRKLTVNGVADYTESVSTSNLRLPILAKLNIPLGLGHLWLGVGPEFTLYQSSSGKLDAKIGGTTINADASVGTRDVKPTFGTGGLGLVIEIPLVGVEIPIEFRASKNLSQPSNWNERVTIISSAGENVRAESSWVLRLGAGFGFQF